MLKKIFFPTIVPFMSEFAKSCTAGHTRDDNIENAHCMLDT